MMDLITLEEIAGNQLDAYENFYLDVNPSNSNIIKALDAANFLRKSGLNQAMLKMIWDLSDPKCLGYLDKKSFFISLKLVSMVQNGKQANINDLRVPLPLPKINEDIFKSVDWAISPDIAQKYTAIFNSLAPIDEKLSGNKVKPYMVNSKLPIELLTKIWDMSDIDQDGFLNLKEFQVSCQLIAKASQGFSLPAVLPMELLNYDPCTTTDSLPRSLSRTSTFSSGSASPHPASNEKTSETVWVISAEEKSKSDELFAKLDKDHHGYLTGMDLKDTLMESRLPQQVLAHIWNLSDINTTGKLNSEQFALANWLIKQKQSGIELPPKLLPNMIPPSFRPKNQTASGNQENQATPPSTGNKELDALHEEIRKLQNEKTSYEMDVNNEEASLRLKQSEIKSVQNEIEALAQMLKQLENQKNDASKRLDDLSQQVENLNRQYAEQKKGIEDHEQEFTTKRTEFEQLKQEETVYEAKLKTAQAQMDQVAKLAAETQLEISHVKANSMELEEYERRCQEMLYDYDQAIMSSDYAKIMALLPRTVTPPPFISEETSFEDFNAFKTEFNSDPFAGEDPFKDDSFGAGKTVDTFGQDGFADFDAFSSNNNSNNTNDAFGFASFPETANNDMRGESPTPALPPKKSLPPPRPAPPKSSTVNKTPLRAAPPPPAALSQKTSNAFGSNFDPFNDNRDPFGSDTFFSPSAQQQNQFANFADFGSN